MDVPSRWGALQEHLRGSLWFLPSMAVGMALIAGTLLAQVSVDPESFLAAVVFAGGADGARAVLQVVAGSVITVTGVTFSLTVVALTNAASLYSPRVLRTFLRDRGNQVVLSTFLATFAYCIMVLRTVRAESADSAVFVPRVALSGAIVLALASLAALVYFFHHVTQSLRVETILREVQQETLRLISRSDGPGRDAPPPPAPPARARPLRAQRSGYLQSVTIETLRAPAADRDVVVWLRRTLGEQVTPGTVLAWVWTVRDVGQVPDTEELEEALDRSVWLTGERTLEKDISFGIRQLVDIAIRALSPSLNDPTTAVDALGHLSVVLGALAGVGLGPERHADGDDVTRVGIPRPTFGGYLELACDQVARYGAGDPAAVEGVMRLLEDVGRVTTDDDRLRDVAIQISRTLSSAEETLSAGVDRARVRRAARNARAAVGGRPAPARSFTL